MNDDLIPLMSSSDSFTDDLMTLPEGEYDAVCCFVADCGMQESSYMGQTSMRKEVAIGFELEVSGLDHHVVVYKKVKNTVAGNGNLYDIVKTLIDWRSDDLATPYNGKTFNLQMLLNCQASIRMSRHGKNGNEYKRAIIKSIYRGTGKIVQPSQPAYAYGLKMGRNDVFAKLPFFLQRDIEKNWNGGQPAVQQSQPAPMQTQPVQPTPVAPQPTAQDMGEPIDPVLLADIPF